MCWLQPNEATAGGGHTDRTAAVRAQSCGNDTSCDSHRAAARGTAGSAWRGIRLIGQLIGRGEVGVFWGRVANRLGVGRHPDLGGVRRRCEDCTASQQFRHGF